jgi:hypothetical protein
MQQPIAQEGGEAERKIVEVGLHGREGLKMLRAALIVVAAHRRLKRRNRTLRAFGAGSRRRAACTLSALHAFSTTA